ncbi:hypothetical protein, partial [Vibrio sp. 1401]|uniref:hypothetical protein n=1 Tax=Vibrio sp. 1401 TaxID=3074553 RepID=UPI0029640B46
TRHISSVTAPLIGYFLTVTTSLTQGGPFKGLTDVECCETAIAMAVSNGILKKCLNLIGFSRPLKRSGPPSFTNL